MNATSSGPAPREGLAIAPEDPARTNPSEAAWNVLEAANDLGDNVTVEICRRIIDANLNGTPASPSDLHVIVDYFR